MMIHVIDAILGLVIVEGMGLAIFNKMSRRGLAPGRYIANLTAGFFLLLTTRSVLAASPIWVLLACLLGALGAHLIDLVGRWQKY